MTVPSLLPLSASPSNQLIVAVQFWASQLPGGLLGGFLFPNYSALGFRSDFPAPVNLFRGPFPIFPPPKPNKKLPDRGACSPTRVHPPTYWPFTLERASFSEGRIDPPVLLGIRFVSIPPKMYLVLAALSDVTIESSLVFCRGV